MMREIRTQIAVDIQRALEEITGATVEVPRVEDPPRREMGDLACTAALQVAKQLGRNPTRNGELLDFKDTHGGDWDEWDDPGLRVREFPRYFHDYRAKGCIFSTGRLRR